MNAKFQRNSTSLTLFILLLLFISTVSDALHSKKSPHHTDDDSIEEGSGMIPDDEDLATVSIFHRIACFSSQTAHRKGK